jgi:hypothetical protein
MSVASPGERWAISDDRAKQIESAAKSWRNQLGSPGLPPTGGASCRGLTGSTGRPSRSFWIRAGPAAESLKRPVAA